MGQTWCTPPKSEDVAEVYPKKVEAETEKSEELPVLLTPAESPGSCKGLEASAAFVCTGSNDWEGTYDPVFVNGMMRAVWPMVDKFSKHIVSDVVQPAVKKALGALGESFSIDEDSYTLGNKAVQLGPMQIAESMQNTADPSDPAVRVMTIRTQIAWDAELRASAHLAGYQMGITELRLQGDLVMELVGEVPKPPLFEGARACFMKPPKISLNVHSGVGIFDHVSQLGPVKGAIVDVVTEQLSAKLLVPNRMGIKLVSDADVFRTLHPPPRGMLRLTVSHAEGLLAQDWHFFSKATSDPLVHVVCGAMKFQSPTVQLTTSPEFNYDVLIPIHHPSEQFITLQVLDHDLLSKDDFLGQIELSVKDLIVHGPSEQSYELEDEKGKVGNRGKIWLKSEWRELQCSVSPSVPLAGTDAILNISHLFVGVYCAKHVPVLAPDTKYWVEVQCTGRLGLQDTHVSHPKTTQKEELKGLEQFEEERAAENELWQERKAICAKYKISEQDMSKLLGVDVGNLKSQENMSVVDSTVKFDKALGFFLSRNSENVVSISLKYQQAACKDPLQRGATAAPGAAKRSLIAAAASTIGVKMREKVSHKLGEDTSHLVHTWDVKVSDIQRGGTSSSKRLLKTPGQASSLQLHFRLMDLGEPSTHL